MTLKFKLVLEVLEVHVIKLDCAKSLAIIIIISSSSSSSSACLPASKCVHCICLYVSLSVCLSVCLSACLSVQAMHCIGQDNNALILGPNLQNFVR